MKIHSKNMIKLIAPLLVFPILFLPYQLLNSAVLVDWLGCGCPKVDASGEMIHDYFSANDFTRIFWLVITVGVTVLSWFLSKNVFKEKKWIRVIYVAVVFCVSMVFAYLMIRAMLWN